MIYTLFQSSAPARQILCIIHRGICDKLLFKYFPILKFVIEFLSIIFTFTMLKQTSHKYLFCDCFLIIELNYLSSITLWMRKEELRFYKFSWRALFCALLRDLQKLGKLRKSFSQINHKVKLSTSFSYLAFAYGRFFCFAKGKNFRWFFVIWTFLSQFFFVWTFVMFTCKTMENLKNFLIYSLFIPWSHK